MANLYLTVKGQTLTAKSDIDRIVENSVNYLQIKIDTSQDPEWDGLTVKCIISNGKKNAAFYHNSFITETYLKAPGFVVNLVGFSDEGVLVKVPTNPLVVHVYPSGILDADDEPEQEIQDLSWAEQVVESFESTIKELSQNTENELFSKQEKFEQELSEQQQNFEKEIERNLDRELEEIVDVLNEKQSLLISGENIKTINGESILSSGDINLEEVKNKSLQITNESTDKDYPSAKATFTLVSETHSSINNAVANAIQETKTGKNILRLDNVSPVEHDIKLRVFNKNLLNIASVFVQEKTESKPWISSVTSNSLTISLPEGYSGNGYCLSEVTLKDLCPGIQAGKQYFLSGKTTSLQKWFYLYNTSKSCNFGEVQTFTSEDLLSKVIFYGQDVAGGDSIGDCVISELQMEEGITATAYEEYVDLSSLHLYKYGKNLITKNDVNVESEKAWGANKIEDIEIVPGTYTLSFKFHQQGEDKSVVGLAIKDTQNLSKTIKTISSSEEEGEITSSFVIEEEGPFKISIYAYSNITNADLSTKCFFEEILFEAGEEKTSFEKFLSKEEYEIDSLGELTVKSLSPTTTFLVKNSNIKINYNADISKYVQEEINKKISNNNNSSLQEDDFKLFSKYKPYTQIVEDCQDASKWTIENSSGLIVTEDTRVGNFIFGKQSLHSDKLMSCTAHTYDLTNNYLIVKIRINSIDTGARLYAMLSDTNHVGLRYELARGTNWTVPENWQEIIIPINAYAYGTEKPNFSQINHIKIFAERSDGSAGGVDWNLQYIGTRPRATNKGIVTFTFDDGWSSQYAGVKLLAEKGITSTIFTIKEAVESGNYLTLDEIKSLVNLYGTDIEVHGDPAYTNPIWTEDKLREHWSESQKFIRENNLGEGRHLAYPNGMFPENVVELAKDYFDSCRTIIPFMPIETLPVADRYRIRAVSGVGSNNSSANVEKIKEYLDRITEDGGWLVLVLHKIGDALGDTMYCSEEDLSAIADYAIDSGVDIMNYAEVMERFYADLSPEKDTTVSGGNVEIPENIEITDNKVTIIDENSTDEQYASAKATYDEIQKQTQGKQDKLVSGQNVKTINGVSLLGSGNIVIEGTETNGELLDVTELDQKVADALGRDSYYRDITETFTLKAGVYLASNGTYKSVATGQCTEIFPVTQGEKYEVTGSYSGTYCLVALYDENKGFIKSIGRADLDGYDGTLEYIVPETETDANGVEKKVAYMVCSSYEANRVPLKIRLEINGFNRPQEIIDKLSDETNILFDTVYKGQSIKQYTVQNGTLADGTGSEISNNNRKRTDFISIYGTKIRIVIPDGLQVYIWEFDEDKNFVKYSGWHKGTVEYEASNPYIRLTVKNDAGNSTITAEQVQGIVVADCNPAIDSTPTVANFSFFATNDKKIIVRAENTYSDDGAYLDIEDDCSLVFYSSITSKVMTTLEELSAQLNDGLSEGQEIFTKANEKYTLVLKSGQFFVFDVIDKRYKVIKSADLSSNHAIILSVYSGVVSGSAVSISNFNEIQDIKDLHPLLTDVENRACKTFSELFVSTTGRVETLLFFTDPYLTNTTDLKPEFEFTLDKIKAVYNNAPVSTCVCGGDWLLYGNTKENASWLLGRIDGAMKSRFGKYISIFGNHDTNEQGYEYTVAGNSQAESPKCRLSNSTLANLWYREQGKNYFSTDGDCTKFYVFDTGSGWEIEMSDYKWEQVDWFANSLLTDKPERCAILLHIGSKDYVATQFVDNLTKVAKAFNDKTILTLNDKTYDFTNSTGHLYFALAGHAHVDMHFVQNDIPVVFTANVFFNNYVATDVPNYDLVLADYGANKIRLVRVGLENSHEGTDDFDENGIRTFDMA